MQREGDEVKAAALLKKQGFRYKKKWGQNFIFNTNLLRRIVGGAEVAPGDRVLEIGAGAGTLTRILAEAGAAVLAIEIDNELIPTLEKTTQGSDVTILQGDVLKLDLDELTKQHGFAWPYKIVANLPYYITTPVIMNILENKYHFEQMVIMVQREVAARLTAVPGTKDYGAISLAVRYYTEPSVLFKVDRRQFYPAPEVDSAVVLLQKRKQSPVDVYNEGLMFKIIKAAFGQRRKMLLNALQMVEPNLSKDKLQLILQENGIDPRRRGETLSLQEYAMLANSWDGK